MSYSKKFEERLNAGETMIRRIWLNKNSKKGQYSVQFMKAIENPSSLPENEVVALFQGFNSKQRITAIGSVSETVIKAIGIDKLLTDGEGSFFAENEATYSTKDLLGLELDIQVTENTKRNPFSSTQEPKINPSTGEVLTKDGEPIYRHTAVVMAGKASHSFLAHDTAGVVDTSKVEDASIVSNDVAEEVN